MKLLWSFLPLRLFNNKTWPRTVWPRTECLPSDLKRVHVILFKLSTAGANMTTLMMMMMMIYIYTLSFLWLLVVPSSTWILVSLFSLQWWPSAIQFNFCLSLHFTVHSSGAVWESRWTSWAVRPNEPSGFRGRKELLNRASALVTTCP